MDGVVNLGPTMYFFVQANSITYCQFGKAYQSSPQQRSNWARTLLCLITVPWFFSEILLQDRFYLVYTRSSIENEPGRISFQD